MTRDSSLFLFLGLVFVGMAAAGKPKGASSPASGSGSGSGSGASTGKRPAKTAANATRADARPTAATAAPPLAADSEEEKRQRAGVNAAITQALKDGTLDIDLNKASEAQQEHLIRDGDAAPEPAAGPSPNPPPGGAASDLAVPRNLLTPPATATLPGGRTPKSAAMQLLAFLVATKRFGGGSDRPNEIKDAQTDLGVKPDGIVGPVTRAAAAAVGVTLPRSPRDAAADLAAFLRKTKRFGSNADKPAEVKAAQSDLGVEPDGLVGPKTRAAAKKYGVTLPAKG